MQQWNRETIVALLARSDKAVEHALIVLYKRQTSAEQMAEQTRERNGRGFTAFDAEIFSSFAKRVLSGRHLTGSQMDICRKCDRHGNLRIGRYWSQLLEEIERNQQNAA